LLPDYHAPWQTGDALFQPMFQIIGRSGLPVRVAYYLFDILCYWAAALALIEAARVFLKTRRQMLYAALMVLCAVPPKLYLFVLARRPVEPADSYLRHRDHAVLVSESGEVCVDRKACELLLAGGLRISGRAAAPVWRSGLCGESAGGWRACCCLSRPAWA
jgi:hypothetical protein